VYTREQVNEVSVVFVQYPDDCCPRCFDSCRCRCCDVVAQSAFCRHFWTLRCRAYTLVEHRYFETFIIAMIVASSLSLVCSFMTYIVRSTTTSMSVLLIVRLKCTLATLRADRLSRGEYVDRTDRQTDGRTDAGPLHYAFR